MDRKNKCQVLAVQSNGGNKINKKTIIVYRDKLLLESETFISRSYDNFQDYEIVYVCSKLGWSHKNISKRKILVSTNPFFRFLFKKFGYIQNLRKLKKIQPSLIHAHFGTSGALALPIAKQLGIPLIVTFHGGDITKHAHIKKTFFQSVFKKRLKELKTYSSAFLGVSNFISSRLIEEGFPEKKIFTHYLGIKFIKNKINTCNQNNFLFLGRLVEKKGVDILIDAIRILNKEEVYINLNIAGSGSLEKHLKRRSSDLKNINFLGWKSKEEVKQILIKSKALIVPSQTAKNGDSEGLPTVILEGLSYGSLIIASNHSGIPEIIKNKISGYIFQEGNAKQLSQVIKDVMTLKDDERNNIIEQGQKILEEKFNSSKQSKNLEILIDKLIKQWE